MTVFIKQLYLMETLWNKKSRRNEQLIIEHVSANMESSSIMTRTWAFQLTFSFRDAIDISYVIKKRPYVSELVWTQGPRLNFHEGDMIQNYSKTRCVQVVNASPASWNIHLDQSGYGHVMFKYYELEKGRWTSRNVINCSQMDFLGVLITGDVFYKFDRNLLKRLFHEYLKIKYIELRLSLSYSKYRNAKDPTNYLNF